MYNYIIDREHGKEPSGFMRLPKQLLFLQKGRCSMELISWYRFVQTAYKQTKQHSV
jgi:hypothetical protein